MKIPENTNVTRVDYWVRYEGKGYNRINVGIKVDVELRGNTTVYRTSVQNL